MSTPLETVSADATVSEAAARMRDRDVNALLVPGTEMGIVTSTDVRDAVAEHPDASSVRVADVVTRPVETIGTDVRLREAAAMMTSLGIKHLPVVDGDGDYVGMVSSTDVTSALG